LPEHSLAAFPQVRKYPRYGNKTRITVPSVTSLIILLPLIKTRNDTLWFCVFF